MDVTTIIGILGAGTVLIAFLLNQVNKLKNSDLAYDALNFVGSALLMLYAILLSSWPFLILNTVWAAVSLRDVVVKLSKR
jgi:hypothetical protein